MTRLYRNGALNEIQGDGRVQYASRVPIETRLAATPLGLIGPLMPYKRKRSLPVLSLSHHKLTISITS